jgi:hypothetical protein
MWRGVGALVVGTALHFAVPRETSAPQLSRTEPATIAALRIADIDLGLPEFKLWGAGPPTDFHIHVAVSVPPVDPEPIRPERTPLRRTTPASVIQTPVPMTPSAPETRPAQVRAPVDAEAPPAEKPVQRSTRKAANVPVCERQPVSFGGDTAVDSPLHPRVTFKGRCTGS